MLDKYFKNHQQKQLALFVLKAFLLYTTWFIAYDVAFERDGWVNVFLNHRVATDAAALLNLLGYHTSTAPGNHQTIVLIDGIGIVAVGNPCNGLEIFALFAGFILCFPGSFKAKLWFIPLGLVAIHFINVLRTLVLSLIQLKAPEHLDFNHHYTFTVIVYAFIFGLWMLWTNKFSGLDLSQNSSTAASNE